MKVFEFIENFPDEESCKLHFKEVREKDGIVCTPCSVNKLFLHATRGQKGYCKSIY